MEGNGNSQGKLPEYPPRPVPSFEAMKNDGHLAEPDDVPVAGGDASVSRDPELQGVPDVPGWKPEWVQFLKTRGDMTVIGDRIRHAYTCEQITDLLHGEFGPETFKLTVNDIIHVWSTYIEPAPSEGRKGKSPMHQNDHSGETSMPAGGSTGQSQSGNGYHYGAPNDNPGGIYRAAPPNAYATVHNGQSSRHEYYGAHNRGASSSREGPQAGHGYPQHNPPRKNGPLPPLRSLDIWGLGRVGDSYRASPRFGSSSRAQEPTHAAAVYDPSRIPAPRNAGAAAHYGVIHPQPRRYIPGLLRSPRDQRS